LSLIIRKHESKQKKKVKKFRIVILLWEVEPRVRLYKEQLVSEFKSIETRRRFERDFDELGKAVSVYNVLTEKLKEFWQSVTLRR